MKASAVSNSSSWRTCARTFGQLLGQKWRPFARSFWTRANDSNKGSSTVLENSLRWLSTWDLYQCTSKRRWLSSKRFTSICETVCWRVTGRRASILSRCVIREGVWTFMRRRKEEVTRRRVLRVWILDCKRLMHLALQWIHDHYLSKFLEMMSLIISLVPSRIWCTRRSRTYCSMA